MQVPSPPISRPPSLVPVSSCPDCGAPIYGPGLILEKFVEKIKIIFTCKCVRKPDETIEPLKPDEVNDG